MSAILGILRFDGARASARDLERMGNALAPRGPDARRFLVQGSVGLGHCLLRVNHEDMFERQPLRDVEADLTLVADCRIDNREELAADLQIPAQQLRDMPDSALLLRAYRQWGEACAERLLGDFAFALWDGRARKLVLARDHMGQRTILYHRGKDFFAFASSFKGLMALPDVPQRLSMERVAAGLIGAARLNHVPGATAFDGIEGLPGAPGPDRIGPQGYRGCVGDACGLSRHDPPRAAMGRDVRARYAASGRALLRTRRSRPPGGHGAWFRRERAVRWSLWGRHQCNDRDCGARRSAPDHGRSWRRLHSEPARRGPPCASAEVRPRAAVSGRT